MKNRPLDANPGTRRLASSGEIDIDEAARVAEEAARRFGLSLREEGRRLASRREDLIALGVNPADLEIPL